MKKKFLIYSLGSILIFVVILHVYYLIFPTWNFLLSGEVTSRTEAQIIFETSHPPYDSYIINNKRNITIVDSTNNTPLDFTLLQKGDVIDVIYTKRVNRFASNYKQILSNGDVITNIKKITKK